MWVLEIEGENPSFLAQKKKHLLFFHQLQFILLKVVEAETSGCSNWRFHRVNFLFLHRSPKFTTRANCLLLVNDLVCCLTQRGRWALLPEPGHSSARRPERELLVATWDLLAQSTGQKNRTYAGPLGVPRPCKLLNQAVASLPLSLPRWTSFWPTGRV